MTEINLPADKTLLLVDDDKPFLMRLARAMETRGFEVRTAESVAEGIQQVKKSAPGYAVVDLRLSDGNGLDVIETLHASARTPALWYSRAMATSPRR
jgi:two-component system response regulator RegA